MEKSGAVSAGDGPVLGDVAQEINRIKTIKKATQSRPGSEATDAYEKSFLKDLSFFNFYLPGFFSGFNLGYAG